MANRVLGVLLAIAPAGACLEGRLHAGESDALWRVLQAQPVKGEAIVGWTPATARPARLASGEERPDEVLATLRAVPGLEVVRVDLHQPYAIVNLVSADALGAVKGMPRITFVEPRYVRLRTAFSCPSGEYAGFALRPEWQVNSVMRAPRFAP